MYEEVTADQLTHGNLLTFVINHVLKPLVLPRKGIPKKNSETLNALNFSVILFHFSKEQNTLHLT